MTRGPLFLCKRWGGGFVTYTWEKKGKKLLFVEAKKFNLHLTTKESVLECMKETNVHVYGSCLLIVYFNSQQEVHQDLHFNIVFTETLFNKEVTAWRKEKKNHFPKERLNILHHKMILCYIFM